MAEFRQWREEKRTMLKDVVPLDTPYNILIEVSSLCNLRCVYCAHSRSDHGVYEGNMTMELFHKILNDIKQFPRKLKLVEMFAFGEPLCNPYLAEMIDLVNKANITEKVNFTTNGLLFNKKNIESIIAAGVDTIRISLQGLDSDSYKKVCGANVDFPKFLQNLNYLYEHKGKCKIRMKIADLALKDVENGKEKFEKMFGNMADSLFIETIIPMFSGIDYNELDKNIYVNAINGRENVRQVEIHKVCHRPFYRLRIASNGDVTAACCDTPNDIYYGNLNKNNLIDLWNKKTHRAFLKMQLQGNRFKHPICVRTVCYQMISLVKPIY